MSKFFQHMPCGVRAGVNDWKHHTKIGPARTVFDWAVQRQTGAGVDGVLDYGRPFTFARIAAEINFPPTTVKRHIRRLEQAGYLRRDFRPDNSFVLWVCNQKKFVDRNPQSATFPQYQVGSSLVRGSDQTCSEGQTKRGGVRASKRQKTLWDTAPNVSILEKECTKIGRTSPAEAPPSIAEQKQEKPKTIRQVAIEHEIPRAYPSARELDASRRAQLEAQRRFCERNGIRL